MALLERAPSVDSGHLKIGTILYMGSVNNWQAWPT